MNFVTIKNTHKVESHIFEALSGSIDTAGDATLVIDLSSVNTNNTTRDPRMRNILFEVDSYPEAVITIDNATSLIPSDVGATQISAVTASISLHGVNGVVETQLLVQRLSANRVMVKNVSPILVTAADYGLDVGIEELRNLASLSVISTVVPVDFVLFFE